MPIEEALKTLVEQREEYMKAAAIFICDYPELETIVKDGKRHITEARSRSRKEEY